MYVTECICLEERGWPPRRHPDKARGSGAPVCSAMDHSTLVRSCANRTATVIRYDTSPDKPPPRFPSSPISNTPCGSSGCLGGGKLVIAQDAAQRLADLRMQCFCLFVCSFLQGSR